MAKALTQLAVKAAKPAHNRVEIPDGGCTGSTSSCSRVA